MLNGMYKVLITDLWKHLDYLYQEGVRMDNEDVKLLSDFNQFLTDVINDKINK